MKNCYELNFSGNFVCENLNLTDKFNNPWQTIDVSMNESISVEGQNFLKKLNVFPTNINLFIGDPLASTRIHIDSTNQSYALNYSWGSIDSTMCWYNILDNNYNLSQTTKGNYFFKFDPTQVVEIEKIKLHKKLVIVRIDKPHAVYNHTNEKRYCLSVRCSPKFSWEKIINHLSPYIL
jgi:hypothetical protein